MDNLYETFMKIKEGDEESFELFYNCYEDRLLRHIKAIVGKDEIAYEVIHELCLKIIQSVGRAKFSKKNEKQINGWVYRIATNISIDHLRKSKREMGKLKQDEEAFFEVDTSFELETIMEKLFDLLPVKQRTFLSLKVNDGLSYKEIARSCSCSVDLVKQGIFLGRKTLKEELSKLGYKI